MPGTTTKLTALNRSLRTGLQLVASGGLTGLVAAWADGLSGQQAALVLAAAQVVVTFSQNLLEDLGWIPAVFKPQPVEDTEPLD